RAGAATEHPLGAHRIEAAGAPGMASQQPPRGEDQAAKYAELADRLYCVIRAARRVAAAGPQQRRDRALVEADRRHDRLAAEFPHDPTGAFASNSPSAASSPDNPSASPSSRAGPRATTTMSWPLGSASAC